MTHHAWHYDIEPAPDSPPCARPVAGMHGGTNVETREQAIENIARIHGVSPDRVKVRKAGEAW